VDKAKGIIILMFGITLFLVIKQYYKDPKKSGTMPDPRVIGKPTYLFAFLLLINNALEGLPVIFAVAAPMFYYLNNYNAAPKAKPTTANKPKGKG
jgi:hypothetical protein